MVAKELADSPGRAGMPGPACPADADKGRSIATRGAVRVRARPTRGAGPDPADEGGGPGPTDGSRPNSANAQTSTRKPERANETRK